MAIILILQSCAFSEPEPIMTDEKFNYRSVENNKIEFVFGVSWRNTSTESILSNNERRVDDRPSGRGERPEYEFDRPRFAVQADNQTKLELEDNAALSLKSRLEKEQLCKNGYEITEVIWRDDNIRLLGHCL